jgi:hypothetical protein
MKVLVFVITYNCADVIGYFLRHYSAFADEISAFDDFSNDGTRELLKANPKVLLRDWPHPGCGINEDLFLAHWQEWYPKARGGFDWVMIVDPDEFLWSPDVRATLEFAYKRGYQVALTEGFNMTGDGLPKDDGRQIWEIAPWGVAAPVYSKPVVFDPNIKINWIRGKHALENCNPILSRGPLFKLLHYRYMGANYTAAKNAKNYARCGLDSGDKGAAWSCSPGYNGIDKEHSPLWAEEAKKKAINVLEL